MDTPIRLGIAAPRLPACCASCPLETLFEEFRVGDRRKEALKPALRRHTVASLRELLLAAHQVERAIKGASPGDPWLMLAEVVIGLTTNNASQRKRNYNENE